MHDPNQMKSSVPDIKHLISEYPQLALPIGVFISLLGLATIIKTLIEGFTWAHTEWGYLGVLWAIGGSILILIIAIIIIKRALRPRPIIHYFPTPYLSKSPTIKWTYDEPKNKKVTYNVLLKERDTQQETRIGVPQRMYHADIRNIYGPLTIVVKAVVNGKIIRSSRAFATDIYLDALHRITLTRKMRIAVHADPGEEVFCFYRDDKWQGFDIDFANLIAKHLQSDLDLTDPIEVEYLFYEWPEVITAPNDYKVDFAIASISISADRARSHNIMFSQHYAESTLGLVANTSAFVDDITSPIRLDLLTGKTIAFHNATTAASFVENVKHDHRYKGRIIFQVANNNDQLRELLKNGSVDAVIYDYERAFSLLEHGMVVQHLEHDIDIDSDKYGLTFAKISTRLRDRLNIIITKEQAYLRSQLAERVSHQSKSIAKEGTFSLDTKLVST